MEKLGTETIKLYEDICRAGGLVDNLSSLTKEQVGFIISLKNNGIHPEYRDNIRAWRVPNKGKHGGFLRLSQAAKTLEHIGGICISETGVEKTASEN